MTAETSFVLASSPPSSGGKGIALRTKNSAILAPSIGVVIGFLAAVYTPFGVSAAETSDGTNAALLQGLHNKNEPTPEYPTYTPRPNSAMDTSPSSLKVRFCPRDCQFLSALTTIQASRVATFNMEMETAS